VAGGVAASKNALIKTLSGIAQRALRHHVLKHQARAENAQTSFALKRDINNNHSTRLAVMATTAQTAALARACIIKLVIDVTGDEMWNGENTANSRSLPFYR